MNKIERAANTISDKRYWGVENSNSERQKQGTSILSSLTTSEQREVMNNLHAKATWDQEHFDSDVREKEERERDTFIIDHKGSIPEISDKKGLKEYFDDFIGAENEYNDAITDFEIKRDLIFVHTGNERFQYSNLNLLPEESKRVKEAEEKLDKEKENILAIYKVYTTEIKPSEFFVDEDFLIDNLGMRAGGLENVSIKISPGLGAIIYIETENFNDRYEYSGMDYIAHFVTFERLNELINIRTAELEKHIEELKKLTKRENK